MAATAKVKSGNPRSTFPRPKFLKVQDRGGKQNCLKFFEYWESISKVPYVDLIEVRVYRHYPVVNLKLADPDRKDSVWHMWTGAIPFKPEDYMDEFLHQFGSGRWNVYLNEANVHGEIMQGYFSAIDYDRYPPKLDLRTVLHDGEVNEDYLRWLALNNVKTPWDNPVVTKDEEDLDMASSGDALRTVTDSFVKMAEKNMEVTEQVAEARVQAATTGSKEPSAESLAQARIVDMMGTATDKTIDMITKHAGPQFDPVALMETSARLFRNDNQSGELSAVLDKVVSVIEKSNERALTIQEKQLDFMKSFLGGNNGNGSTALVPAAPKSLLEQLREQHEIAALLGFTRGGSSRENGAGTSEPAEPRAPEKSFAQSFLENAGPLMAGLSGILVLAGNIMYNMRLKPGEQPISPQEAIAKAAAQAQTPSAMPGADPAAQNPQPADPRQMWMAFIQQIEKPFLGHMFGEDLNGYTLAQFVLSNGSGGGPVPEGRRVYMTIKEQLGIQGFDALVKAHFPLWSRVQGLPQQYQQFMKEFFTYDEWVAEQQGQPEPAPAGAPN